MTPEGLIKWIAARPEEDIIALREACGDCSEDAIVAGCRQDQPKIDSYDDAKKWLGLHIGTFLNCDRYEAAGQLLWSRTLFDLRPKSVSRVISAIEQNAKVIVLGAASMGKSYSIIGWMLLDWLRDPEYSGCRIISTTSSHALENTFSSLQRFYDEAIIKLPGLSQRGFIGLNRKDRHASLSVIAIKEGDTGRNTLQGFHPIRRRIPHPKFGALSRIRIFLDECELIPMGVWRGVSNILSNIYGVNTVKVICACNPWDVTSTVAANSEPAVGWNRVDADKDLEWESKAGWRTIRLDAAYSENVLQKKEVFAGLQTAEGYEQKRSKTGGNDAEYWCYGRGLYPLAGTIDQLIPLSFLDDVFGNYIFDPGTAVNCGAVDLAFEGDDCIFFAGRYGRTSAFHVASSNEIIKLDMPRYCLQADQFITLKKVRTEGMYDQILEECGKFGTSTRWLAIDKTGVGRGVHDLFIERGHGGVLGIGWGNAATHIRTLSEHRAYADEVCSGIAAQMYFSLRDYLEFGFIKFNPSIDMSKLQKEIIGRKKKRAGKGPTGETMYAMEEKSHFKARYNFSPDRCDALCMMLFLCITRGSEGAQMEKRKKPPPEIPPRSDENPPFIDFSEAA